MSSSRSVLTRVSQPLRASAATARNISSSSRLAQAPVPRPTKPASQTQPSLPPTPKSQLEQIKQYPAHPLLQFFRTRPHEISDKALGGPAAYETGSKDSITPPKFHVRLPHAVHQSDLRKDGDSRSWLASELRLKSSKDLHTLWYVLLMERNRLATSWEELNRVGARQAANMWSQNLGRKNHRVRKSMARIKFVLNERRLALIEAQKQVREATPMPEPGQGGSLFEEADVEVMPASGIKQ
ncbi:Ribosomal protein L47, mitochondrial [Kalmanozyma brasiliensis GHG001]|uniref:Large ribosomal subunit protein uL29m n=1 Tax=Kalmanozyma brasiliensis (strain GHG001) TaxID=1365824 RepID=V5EKZ0_KALBG|nr:Ribosomal protein L47, mitochondrial [Kalmanozyma brasiliensis GHG001]EST05660.1 Ribosomal protein L47, mitochondrial [Kalmanozyma brasiliensis GHG001]